MRVLLISTYELGRQPFGLASPAAWLRARGADVVCQDISRDALDEAAVRAADLIAFYVPMHTATRLGVALLPTVQRMNPEAHICFYGLYAPVNETYLRRLGVGSVFGGEFEKQLTGLAERIGAAKVKDSRVGPAADGKGTGTISLERLKFITPDREGLPELGRYARLVMPTGERRVVGYTEASRGCKHLCRHCPIVPVYNGTFRIVARDVVMEDVRRQVAAGAQHITFGDPDFFNGIGHALPIVEELHREFPQITYDATIKIEHLLKYRHELRRLRETGCLLVTSAVESVDDAILERLDKRHTRADFLLALELCHSAGLAMQATFVPFTPWTTLEGYADLLAVLRERGLAEGVAPIQLAIRLLIPSGSRLLELEEVRANVGAFDEAALIYPWRNADVRVDRLCEDVGRIVQSGEGRGLGRAAIFAQIEGAVRSAMGAAAGDVAALGESAKTGDTGCGALRILTPSVAIPYLDEPWYCCAEPAGDQFARVEDEWRKTATRPEGLV